jgi:hypothetical protein
MRSTHVYGCDKVLWTMTAQVLHGPPGADLRLLDPGDPARQVYLAEVVRLLGKEPSPPAFGGRLKAIARRLQALVARRT